MLFIKPKALEQWSYNFRILRTILGGYVHDNIYFRATQGLDWAQEPAFPRACQPNLSQVALRL